jgi:hypothetical protein
VDKHKVFISYHHANDQPYKEALVRLGAQYGLFMDCCVEIGDIDERLDDATIRQKIRDEYLRDSSVTIVLVGTETKYRKHVDWEIYSSMFDGAVNKKSGVLVINLPSTNCTYFTAAHGDGEKRIVYPDNSSWVTIDKRSEYESRYPHMPDRIIDNLLKKGAKVSVTNWDTVTSDIAKLRFLIEAAFNDRATCDYDLSRPMRRANVWPSL